MRLKRSDPDITNLVALRVRQRLEGGQFRAFFGSDVVLVPAPGHAPRRDSNQQAATLEMVKAMARQGLGNVEMLLRRESKVAKAAWAPRGERPTTADHYRTMTVVDAPHGLLGLPRRITVVDDVVTSGSTLFACVRRLRECFPSVAVSAFAAVRTLSDVLQIVKITDPVENGSITLQPSGGTRRDP